MFGLYHAREIERVRVAATGLLQPRRHRHGSLRTTLAFRRRHDGPERPRRGIEPLCSGARISAPHDLMCAPVLRGPLRCSGRRGAGSAEAQARLAGKHRQPARIASGLARRIFVVPWLPEPPVGVQALASLTAPTSA